MPGQALLRRAALLLAARAHLLCLLASLRMNDAVPCRPLLQHQQSGMTERQQQFFTK